MGRTLRFGIATIAVGLLLDVAAHDLGSAAVGDGFAASEHLAHIVVLIGMVVVLAGAIVGGLSTAGRVSRPEGSPPDAIR